MPGIPDDSIPTSFDPSPLDNGVSDLHLPSSISTFNLDRYTNKKKKKKNRTRNEVKGAALRLEKEKKEREGRKRN